MEFRDALKLFRRDTGLAQADIAAALHVNITTVGRWEQGKTVPSRSFAIALLNYAKGKSATGESMDNLKKALNDATKQKLFSSRNSLFTVEHATISQLIEDAAFPIYVCDLETDEILYVNRVAEQQLGKERDELLGKKCYKYIMHRDKPCEFCHKNQLVEDCFSCYEAFRHFDGNYYRVFGKLAKWNGRSAQVRYAFVLGGSIQIETKNELRNKYEEQLEMRRQNAADALALAHYNLTLDTVSQVEYRSEAIAANYIAGRYEDVMHAIEDNIFLPDEKKKFDKIRDRNAMIRCFFQGKTHITVKHRINGFPGYFVDTFDLFQNPVTYDIEAFAALRDITDEAVSDSIAGRILRSSFESIMTIDAFSGETHHYHGKHIEEVIAYQKKHGDNIAGVEAYLRRYCADKDIDRVIRQTRLPYVKEQLKTKPVFTVAYSLCGDGRVIRKQTQYSYLDGEHTTILCAMQDISEAYSQLETK